MSHRGSPDTVFEQLERLEVAVATVQSRLARVESGLREIKELLQRIAGEPLRSV